jgi:glycosyltransferase involved in cell wall biosynthesis
MSKKKILLCNEASFLNTGYSIYGKEVMRRLLATDKYELAELSVYGSEIDSRQEQIPWKYYPNHPNPNIEAEVMDFNSKQINVFGGWRFEEVCLDFRPDIVMDIRDFWMVEFTQRSPFRPMFSWSLMPTVDAEPQNEQWIYTFANADTVLNYSEFGERVLKQQSGGSINCLGVASPSADKVFVPTPDKKAHKQNMGFSSDSLIIGTVMRNQRRKLFPDLFYSFREFLNQTQLTNVYLYCHTSYPDIGWDIPSLLNEHGISSKVIFTYCCSQCQNVYPAFFEGSMTICPRCSYLAAKPSSVHSTTTNEDLAKIYNLFDLYVQYANSEGFGIPQVEAAACGVPFMSVDYSAMESVVANLEGEPIKVKALYKELETGCMRAVPDNDDFVEKLIKFFSLPEAVRLKKGFQTRKLFEQHYTWDKTAEKWESLFDAIPIKPPETTWDSPPRLINIPSEIPAYLPNREYVDWLFTNVLGEPEKIGSYDYARMLRDLDNKNYVRGMGGFYFNEDSWSHVRPEWEKFDKEEAYYQILEIAENKNHWEKVRCGIIKKPRPSWLPKN